MDEIWNKRREQLEAAVRKATLDLFEHTGSAALKLPLDPPHQALFVVAGDERAIKSLSDQVEPCRWIQSQEERDERWHGRRGGLVDATRCQVHGQFQLEPGHAHCVDGKPYQQPIAASAGMSEADSEAECQRKAELSFSDVLAVGYLDGVMEDEPAEIREQWKRVKNTLYKRSLALVAMNARATRPSASVGEEVFCRCSPRGGKHEPYCRHYDDAALALRQQVITDPDLFVGEVIQRCKSAGMSELDLRVVDAIRAALGVK